MIRASEPKTKEPLPLPIAETVPTVRVAASPVRCPFCRDEIGRRRERWVACSSCLARHHAACWLELGACATCGEGLNLPGSVAPRRWLRITATVAALSLLAAVAAASFEGATVVSRWSEKQERRAAAERARSARAIELLEGLDGRPAGDGELREAIEGLESKLEAERSSNERLLGEVRRLEASVADALRHADARELPSEPSVTGVAAAIEALVQLKKESSMSSGEVQMAKEYLLAGRVAPQAVLEVARLAQSRKDGTLSSSEFRSIREQLLSPRTVPVK
jgi:hypothetical protein